MATIRAGFEKGFGEAKEILERLGGYNPLPRPACPLPP
ncbi:MAG: DUF5610 domain-containing protein [Azoarcus sp.]|nr:DUF5610 domain-containing protein [Azoarcus sp.]